MPVLDWEYCGDENQVDAQKRIRRIWGILKSIPFCSNHGRNLAIEDLTNLPLSALSDLVHEFGVLAAAYNSEAELKEIRSSISSLGVDTDFYQQLMATKDQCYAGCIDILGNGEPPQGTTLEIINLDSPAKTVEAFQSVGFQCGVAPPPGYILRGGIHPSVSLVLSREDGTPIATAAAHMRNNEAGHYSKSAWLGLLATTPDNQGKGLARWLMAKSLVEIFDNTACGSVHAFVKPDNAPSQAVCRSVGLQDSKYLGAYMTSRAKYGDGKFTS